ncbi:MAG: hypothetical protein NT099_04245 [Candidatus Saganbacteria bacterium]|nr:hypothetical protein [Candidatus Saganbacteria bacterium]
MAKKEKTLVNDKFKAKANRLVNNDKFKDELKKLREQFKIPINGMTYEEERIWYKDKWGKGIQEIKNFHFALSKFRGKFKLYSNWGIFLLHYILSNKLDYRHFPQHSFDLRWHYNEDTYENELHIIIFPNTTIDDIKNDWAEIKKRQKRLYSYKEKSPRDKWCIERDSWFYELWKRGLTCEEIADIRYTEFPKEKPVPDADLVRKAINRLKNV